MNKKLLESLVEENVGTTKTFYPYDAETEKTIAEFVKQQNAVGNPCRYELVNIQGTSHIALIQPDPACTPEELEIMAQLNCGKLLRGLAIHVKTIVSILTFFCILTCISLITALALTLSQ